MVDIGLNTKNMDNLDSKNKFPSQNIEKKQDWWKIMYLKAGC